MRIQSALKSGTFSLFCFLLLCLSCSSEENNKAKAVIPPPSSSSAEFLQNRPNILLILTDDQGYHDVSYYGTEDLQTPNIDALATDGMRFDNFYANCPVCSPTRAALLSGRYQDRVGVQGVIRTRAKDNWGYLDPNAILLPQVLNIGAYHTALIGKWHLGLESPNIPTERGFDYFKGFLGDMMEDYWTHERHGINYMRENLEEINPKGHATDLFTEWAVEYINEQAQMPQPFFLYLNYNAPHFPVQPPKDWVNKVKTREKGIDDKRAKLVAFIEHMDDGIGKVVQALKQNGLYENTILIFTSDNGGRIADGANNGPLRDGKQSMYEGGLKVPTCIVWKDVVNPGSYTEYKAMSMDLYPTLIEAVGLQVRHPIEGQSFLDVLKGEERDDAERPLFFSRREGNMRYRGLTVQAVQLGDWKLLQNSPFEPQELYNLKTDPQEQNNLAAEKSKKMEELNTLLMRQLQEAGKVPWQKVD